jgi:hypothetical protein
MRLHAIHPDAQVILKEAGFLNLLPEDVRSLIFGTLNDPKHIAQEDWLRFKVADLELQWEAAEPMILNVTWDQEGIGQVSREILIHITPNYNNPGDLKYFDNRIETSALAGIVVEGAPFPSTLNKYIERLEENGAAVLEVYSDNADMRALLNELRRSGKYRIRLVHMETYQRYGNRKPIEQKLYLIQPRKNKRGVVSTSSLKVIRGENSNQ